MAAESTPARASSGPRPRNRPQTPSSRTIAASMPLSELGGGAAAAAAVVVASPAAPPKAGGIATAATGTAASTTAVRGRAARPVVYQRGCCCCSADAGGLPNKEAANCAGDPVSWSAVVRRGGRRASDQSRPVKRGAVPTRERSFGRAPRDARARPRGFKTNDSADISRAALAPTLRTPIPGRRGAGPGAACCAGMHADAAAAANPPSAASATRPLLVVVNTPNPYTASATRPLLIVVKTPNPYTTHTVAR